MPEWCEFVSGVTVCISIVILRSLDTPKLQSYVQMPTSKWKTLRQHVTTVGIANYWRTCTYVIL